MKLYSTIDCTSSTAEIVKKLKRADELGIYGIRINFCKFDLLSDDAIMNIKNVMDIIAQHGNHLRLLFDIPYPYNKIRIIKSNFNFAFSGEIIKISWNEEVLKKQLGKVLIVTKYDYLDSNVGEVIYIGDGETALCVRKIEGDTIDAYLLSDYTVELSRSISIGKIKIPERRFRSFISLLESRIPKNAKRGFMLSLIENDKEINELKRYFSHSETKIIPKIETPQSIECLKEIIYTCDGVLVARGDLCINCGYENLYDYEKKIFVTASEYRREVLIATDIMRNVDSRYIPSRSDIIDFTHMIRIGYENIIMGSELLKNPNMIFFLHGIGQNTNF